LTQRQQHSGRPSSCIAGPRRLIKAAAQPAQTIVACETAGTDTCLMILIYGTSAS